jgi:hypothetical protein
MKTALQKSLKENQASSVGTIKSSATDGKSSLRQVEDIESDLSKARAGKDALIESISETKATRQAYNRLIQEKNELTERIDQKRKSVVPPTDIAELKAKIVRMENETSPDTKPVGLQQAKVNTLRDMYSNVSGDLAQKKATLSDARNILRLISNGVCPTCKQKTEGAIESIGSGIETLEAEVLDAETRLKALIKEGETESLKLKSLGDTYNEKLKALEVTKYEASQLKIAIATAEGVSAYLGDMQKKLEELNHTEIDGQMINLDEAELQLTGLNQSISDLTAEMERKRDYDTKVVLAKQTLKKAKEAEATLELVKALTAKLTEIRWTIVKDALEPIRKEASDLFSLSGQKATFDFQFTDRRGNETFRFGWLFKGDIYDTFVEFASLSTAQQLFTIIALLSPLIHRGNPKFRILLLDNVEVLDEKNKVKFLEMLVRAKESYFDNIIVASSAPFEETPTTVTVHQL